MFSVVLYGRNDSYGYNLHKRAALSFNCIAELLDDPDDEILFVDYNTPNDYPTFPEAIKDTLTAKARERLRILRVRPHVHDAFKARTRLVALEPISRNIAVRRSSPANRWILSTNTDMIFVPSQPQSLNAIAKDLPSGFYHAPRLEIPETLWEGLDRLDPQGAIESVRRWGSELHLNEIVTGSDNILYDGPGDFQLIQRKDLFAISGFDEEMILGWHVDSNISKRLRLLHGKIGDLGKDVWGYHCDHTRQITPMHSHTRTENDWRRFIERVEAPELPAQAETWGCAREEIEEVRLTKEGGYEAALRSVIGSPRQGAPVVAYAGKTFDKVPTDAKHVLPFLMDMFVCSPKATKIAWFGVAPEMLSLAAKAWRALGFDTPLLVESRARGHDGADIKALDFDALLTQADAFVFDFDVGVEKDLDAGDRLLRQFYRVVMAEQARWGKAPLRRIVAVNAVHNYIERYVKSYIAAGHTPFSTRMRHGFALPPITGVENLLPTLQAAEVGVRTGDLLQSMPGKPGYIGSGPYRSFSPGRYRIAVRAGARQAEPAHVDIGIFIDDYHVQSAPLLTGAAGAEIVTSFELQDGGLQKLRALDVRISSPIGDAFDIEAVTLERVGDCDGAKGVETELIVPPRNANLLPWLSPDEAGSLSGSTVEARPGVAGYVVNGPYWRLPAGFYVASIEFDPIVWNDNWEEIAHLTISADTQRIARVHLDPDSARRGRVSAPFEMGGGEAAIGSKFECLMWTSGQAPLTLRAAGIVAQSSDEAAALRAQCADWLPYLLPESAGVRRGSVIEAKAGAKGPVMSGPGWRLPVGAYVASITFDPFAWDQRWADIARMEVSADTRTIGGVSFDPEAAARGVIELPIEIGGDVAPGSRIELVVWTSGEAPIRLTGANILLQEPEMAATMRARFAEWLPYLIPDVAGARRGGAIEAKDNVRGYLASGPYWRLPPGKYRATLSFEPLTWNDAWEQVGVVDVAGNLEALAATALSRAAMEAGKVELDFETPLGASGAPHARMELRVFSDGVAPLRWKSARIEALSPNTAGAKQKVATTLKTLTAGFINNAR